jgi:restriction system protein
MSEDKNRSLVILFPTYDETRHFLRLLDGVSYDLYRSTFDAIWDKRGSHQEPVDWKEPDVWIADRLRGEERELAEYIWKASKNELNPRYMRPSQRLTHNHNLRRQNANGDIEVTERGQKFLAEPEGRVVAEIDKHEGVLTLLQLVSEIGPGKRGDFLPNFAGFCRAFTTCQSERSIKAALSKRLNNLTARAYLHKRTRTYEVTETGLHYLEHWTDLATTSSAIRGKNEIHKPIQVSEDTPELSGSPLTTVAAARLSRQLTQDARNQLGEYLAMMNPFKFEELVKFLLEEMGYTDVETTSPTNDKGVDVVANIELGISSVREVIQVKRHRGNINRTVLDQLRGSLHRFDAVRGTIITTGGFSKGTIDAAFERGAAPITLIDGEKLIDLLVEHEIGVSKHTIEYLDFDDTQLIQFESEDELEEEEDGTRTL